MSKLRKVSIPIQNYFDGKHIKPYGRTKEHSCITRHGYEVQRYLCALGGKYFKNFNTFYKIISCVEIEKDIDNTESIDTIFYIKYEYFCNSVNGKPPCIKYNMVRHARFKTQDVTFVSRMFDKDFHCIRESSEDEYTKKYKERLFKMVN